MKTEAKVKITKAVSSKQKKKAYSELEKKEPGWELRGKIKTFDENISSFTSRIKTLDEQIMEMVENTDEYTEVQRLEGELRIARDRLAVRLTNKPGYNNLLEERADEKDSLKTARLNLSDFLLGYFHDTGERQIEIGPKNAREVILTGKLGKEKKFQTSLFGVQAK